MASPSMTAEQVLAVMCEAHEKLPLGLGARLDQAIVAVRAAFEELEARQWRPISEAPKDTRILAFFSWYGGKWEFAKWNDDRYAQKPRPYWCPETERIYGVRYARESQPALWMAEPTPPQEPDRER